MTDQHSPEPVICLHKNLRTDIIRREKVCCECGHVWTFADIAAAYGEIGVKVMTERIR